MISLILIKKIFSLFLIMLMGFLAVKSGKLRAEDSKIFSTMAAYVIFPCILISAFNMERSPEIIRGVLLSFIAVLILIYSNKLVKGDAHFYGEYRAVAV